MMLLLHKKGGGDYSISLLLPPAIVAAPPLTSSFARGSPTTRSQLGEYCRSVSWERRWAESPFCK